jgi:hypothetical protein
MMAFDHSGTSVCLYCFMTVANVVSSVPVVAVLYVLTHNSRAVPGAYFCPRTF